MVGAALLALAAGVASALNKTCLGAVGSGGTLAPDCLGTREADTLTAGDDNSHNIAGMEGNDIITGGGFHDNIYGDEGNDSIDVQDGDQFEDVVNCGPGKKDTVFFDEGFDTVTGCEKKNPQEQ
jgi:Ca2+-binding RTX toxin-like protein